jgi:hypothetical protein
VIAKISRGWGAGGLVRYLMGPGRFNEHTNQRVIASWDWAPELHQPSRDGSACGFDVRGLTQDLTLPAEAAGVPHQRPSDEPTRRRGPVWHCSLRNAAGDRVLTDDEWAGIAEDLMDRTGIAPRGDHGGCRWVVIRHADDHIHIAAMLVRQDNGRRVHPRNDYYRAAEVCRDAERRFGLTSPAPADRTAAPACTRAETEKAARRGVEETSREWLRRAARTAAVQATDPESFFRRLADLGVKVRPREMPPGHLVGYAVAAPGDVNADGQPVWFGGRRLASDLSLPALLARWRSAPPAPDPIPPLPQEHSRVGQAERAAAVQQATAAARNATDGLHGDPQNGPAVAHATADLLTALSAVTRRSRTPVPWAVSDTFDRAARTPMLRQPRRWPPVAQELRRAAWRLAAARSVSRGREDDSGMAELMVAVAALVAEIAAYHEERRCLAQAAAARRTGRVLPRPSTGGGRRGAEPARTPPTRGGPRRPVTAAAAAAAAVTPAAPRGPAVGRGPGGVGDTGPRQGRSR